MSIIASTKLNIQFGEITVNYHESNGEHCLSLVHGDVCTGEPLLRMHSACIFGEAFAASDCDCRQQLLAALEKITCSSGAVIYLFQEGRGVGLDNKIRAINQQKLKKFDTVQAFMSLGFELDGRDYSVAIAALNDLQFSKSIRLMCNNFRKFDALKDAGYSIVQHVKADYTVTPEANEYLHVKKEKLHHDIDFSHIKVD